VDDVCFINVLVYKRLPVEKGGDIFRNVVEFRVLKGYYPIKTICAIIK
jgi:hypothetical protein